MKILKYIILFLVIISCSTSEVEIDFIHISGVLDNEDEVILFDEINKERKNFPLLLDANFNIAASDRIEFIKAELRKGFFIDHSGYIEAYVFLIPLGIKAVGENLAYHYTNSDSVVRAWVNSETHYKNLSAKKWKYIGIAVGVDEEDNKIYCAIFGY